MNAFISTLYFLNVFGCGCSDDRNLKIETLYPGAGWEVTDVALSFSWNRPNHWARDDDERWTSHAFRVQVGSDKSFDNRVLNTIRHGIGYDRGGFDPNEEYVSKELDHWREQMYMPVERLEAGDYFWRVRVEDDEGTGPWSEAIPFSITEELGQSELVRPLTADNPIFSFDMYDADGGGWGEDPRPLWADVWNTVPEDIQENVALVVPHEYWGRDPKIGGVDLEYQEFLQPLNDMNVPYFIKTGGPDGDFQWYMPLALLEQLYIDNPNFLGVVTGENTWDHLRAYDEPDVMNKSILWKERAIQISAKYGRYVFLGEGSYDFAMEKYLGEQDLSDPDEYDWMNQGFLLRHRDYVVWAPKNNITWSYHHADSLVFGSWLSGTTTHMGLWAEAWYWSDVGYTDVFSDIYTGETDADFSSMPYALWVQMQMMGVSKGTTFFHFGGESGVVNDVGVYDKATDMIYWEDDEGDYHPEDTQVIGFWDMYGNSTQGFDRYIVPFIRAVVHQELIPTKEEALAEVRVAVLPGAPEEEKGSYVCYGDYSSLYRSTYEIEDWINADPEMTDDGFIELYDPPIGCRSDFMPASGRYFWLPILPHPIDRLTPEIEVVSRTQIQTMAEVQEVLDPYYPDRFSGSAWVTQVGESLFVNNSHENTDQVQDFVVYLSDDGFIQSLSGEVQPHSYLMAKRDEGSNGLWIHANGGHKGPYTDSRSTELIVQCGSEPIVEGSPESAVEWAWDAGTGELVLSLSHADGGVNVEIFAP